MTDGRTDGRCYAKRKAKRNSKNPFKFILVTIQIWLVTRQMTGKG